MPVHVPVLTREVVAVLAPQQGGRYLDATVGLGGHAAALLAAGGPEARLWGLDADDEALVHARIRLQQFGDQATLIHGRYEALDELLPAAVRFDAMLFDLGASSLQLDEAERGFSFSREGPLDMRMDRSQGPTAAELLRRLSERELADLIYRWGEERFARRIARALLEAGRREPVRTTTVLAEVVATAVPRAKWPRHIHPATRTFQALRIAVNDELRGLASALEAAVGRLNPGGRLATIAFHSLEDRIVKQTFRRLQTDGAVRILTKRPTTAAGDEVEVNPRARSAKLRALERLAEEP